MEDQSVSQLNQPNLDDVKMEKMLRRPLSGNVTIKSSQMNTQKTRTGRAGSKRSKILSDTQASLLIENESHHKTQGHMDILQGIERF
mmetsp:Transcript_6168/g.10475  ORF Transcript_6168/g.10475 Transcript_6168/m.10475 type:complete len:87 (-) Transcript_6168:336-596(-)